MADPADSSADPDEGDRQQALSGAGGSGPLATGARVTVRQVSADIVHPLRHAILRTGRRWAAAIYPADYDALSAHFAAVLEVPGADSIDAPDDAIVLAVGSVLPEEPDWPDWDRDSTGRTSGAAWRVRGMATRADSRGSGMGSGILDALLAHVSSHGGGLVWCTARLPAMSLYERAGFQTRGAPGAVPGLGDHQVMWVVVPDRP